MECGSLLPLFRHRKSQLIATRGFVKQLAILGSTGSIGRQCLSVVESLAGRFGVVALAAGGNLEELADQIKKHKPEVVSVGDAKKVDELAVLLRGKGVTPLPAIHHGREGMLAVGTHSNADIVVSAAVGVVGLEATYEAVKLGKTVALSNKEVSGSGGRTGDGRGEEGRARAAARWTANTTRFINVCAAERAGKCGGWC